MYLGTLSSRKMTEGAWKQPGRLLLRELGPIMKHKLPLAHIYIGLARGIYFYFHWFPVVYIYI